MADQPLYITKSLIPITEYSHLTYVICSRGANLPLDKHQRNNDSNGDPHVMDFPVNLVPSKPFLFSKNYVDTAQDFGLFAF